MNTKSEAIVIQWKSEGGLGQSKSTEADLTVFANGLIKVGSRFTNGKVVTEQLSKDDFKALRHFVFQEQNIWSIDSSELEQNIQAASNPDTNASSKANTVIILEKEAIADAATTVIRVREGERQHKVSHYNLLTHAQRYPKISGIQRLRAIELHLLALAQRIANKTR